MTTREVTNPTDNIPGDSLYNAAEYAASLRGVLAVSRPGDTITFDAYASQIDLQHELVITQGVTIDGAVVPALGLVADPLDHVMLRRFYGQTVLELDHADATLENLVITQRQDPSNLDGGPDPVGGIDIEGGTVLLDGITIDDTNTAAYELGSVPAEAAGGILVAGGADVTLRNSTIQHAEADAYDSGTTGYDAAGGILVDGSTLHVIGSTVHNDFSRGGTAGANAYASYVGGNAAGGILARNGSQVSVDQSSVYDNYARGGAGAAGFSDVGGGVLGGGGGIGAGGILVESSSLALTNASVKGNLSTGGTGGRGGSPIIVPPSQPGEPGSGGGVGGLGVGGIFVSGDSYASSFGLDLSDNTGTGGYGGYGGKGGTGVHPGTYTQSPGGGGGAGGTGSTTGRYRTHGAGYIAGTAGHDGGPGPTALGGIGGILGEPGSAGYSPQLPNDIYGGGGGGGGGLSAADLAGTIDAVACFAQGTRIATPSGESPVELLREGQWVATPDGSARITWVGHRPTQCARHPDPTSVWPIRIQAGAFGPGKPARDLFLSPEHAIAAGGVLIPVKALINGTTIAQQQRATITYWHVELERHNVLLAEGLPCESFLECSNRNSFSNGGGALRLHPYFAPERVTELVWETNAYAPLRIAGGAVDAVATHLGLQAAALGHAPSPVRPSGMPVGDAIDLMALLDPVWYRATNTDIATAGVDPAHHYAGWGRREGRLPCPEAKLVRALGLIDELTIAITMRDVVAAGVDPAEHFCRHGWKERRRPNPYFDTGWYLDTHDVPDGANPLLHYLMLGERQGLAPCPHFDPAWYRRTYRLAESEVALAHFLRHRRGQATSPNPRFDVAAYVRANGATLRPGRDPYAHFLVHQPKRFELEIRSAA